jgi:hypothetical protein
MSDARRSAFQGSLDHATSQGTPSSADWDARAQEPNATAYQVDPGSASGQIGAYAGDDIRAADGKSAMLGRVEADPDDEWWLIVPD